jgi:hypothetical protein
VPPPGPKKPPPAKGAFLRFPAGPDIIPNQNPFVKS